MMLETVVIVVLLQACAPANPPGSTSSPGASFHGERAFSDLKKIVAIGPRVAGTPASAQTRDYIRGEVERAGLTLQELPFEAQTPLGPRQMVNLVAEVKGTVPGIILIGNHYDTKYFPDFEFVGANDGGSTTAWMIEMARALGPQRTGQTVWLCWFDGEEAFVEWSDTDSLYGSREMVSWLKSNGRLKDIRAMINVDMIGDCSLGIQKDQNAPRWLTDLVWNTASRVGQGKAFLPTAISIEDDHMPFRYANIPALDLIDFRYGGSAVDHQMNWHTSRDRINLVCPQSLQTVGQVMLSVLPALDQALEGRKPPHE